MSFFFTDLISQFSAGNRELCIGAKGGIAPFFMIWVNFKKHFKVKVFLLYRKLNRSHQM